MNALNSWSRSFCGSISSEALGVVGTVLLISCSCGVSAQTSCPDCCASDVERTFGLITVQPDGSIARLHPDGTAESTFVVDLGSYDAACGCTLSGYGLRMLALQPDGRILIAGRFATLNGQS